MKQNSKQIFRYSLLNCFQLKGYLALLFPTSLVQLQTHALGQRSFYLLSVLANGLSTFLYGSEFETLRANHERKLNIFHLRYLRRLLKIVFSLLKCAFLMEVERVSMEPSVWRADAGNSPNGQNTASLQVLLHLRTQSPADKHPDMRNHSFWRAN